MKKNNLKVLHEFKKYLQSYYQIHKNMPKIDRHMIGQKISEKNWDTYILIYNFSKIPGYKYIKKQMWTNISDQIDLLKFLVHTCWDLKIISDRHNILLNLKLVEVGKMWGGIGKSLDNLRS